MSQTASPIPASWRLAYYPAWLVPALIASFANYTVALESNPEASWLRYFTIHLFYWPVWGLIGEVAWRLSPDRLILRDGGLARFVIRQGLLLLVVLAYFSVYFVVINPARFEGSGTVGEYLVALYTQAGPVLFHVMNAVTFLFVLGGALLLRQSRYARSQESQRMALETHARQLEASLAEAKLSVLSNQIHPHFLFNTLNNIGALIEARENDRAYEAIAVLGRLLRKTFEYVRRPSIALREELELITAMMRIGEIRFGDRLSWACHCDAALHAVPVPPFIVQPLVENALRHAVEATAEPVHIEIRITRAGGDLAIEVSDNGPGFDEAHGRTGGVGLENLEERLRLMGAEAPSTRATEPGLRVSFRLPTGTVK